ncbi:F0F1 ATP synthase subunit gamma [Bacteroides propionicifaciens]|uniref:F0F1 ATP synthase subunit gamma n=1 Tax=Bacteroides propionicifaciens TaxID=392838 RepID=UPI00036E33F0|nr:F0F1 ATP synthase subunit gamma [Bacteroides propionicifaciens]
MGSLREVKNRISSVKNTRKITSAMRLVASSKLTRVEGIIANMVPYQVKLDDIVGKLMASDVSVQSPFIQSREIKRIAVVVISSNTTLCGGFNSNVVRAVNSLFAKSTIDPDSMLFYPIGKKIEEYILKKGLPVAGSYQELADKPNYKGMREIAYELMRKYKNKEIDQVLLIYHHFKSLGSQELTEEIYLPFDMDKYRPTEEVEVVNSDYIIEPSEAELIAELLPKVLSQKLFTVLIDSNASEHAARSLAMKSATDNANDLIDDLTLQYNKSRQQAITNELLDIVGGSMR